MTPDLDVSSADAPPVADASPDPADEFGPVLGRLASGGSALVALTAVPALLGLKTSTAATLVHRLVAAGLLDYWLTRPDAPAVCLTPLAASRLGLKLESRCEPPRWVPVGYDPPEPRVRYRRGEVWATNETDLPRLDPDRPPQLDQLVDKRSVPADDAGVYAADVEAPKALAAYAKLHSRFGVVPPPVRFLGMGLAWPVERAEGAPCPGCGGRKLGLAEACLLDGCDRSGVDHMLDAVKPDERPRWRDRLADRLAGGTGKARGSKALSASVQRTERAARKKRKAR